MAAELLRQLLPPLTFGTEDLAVAACFVPTGDLGGDALDYGVDARRAQVAVFDAMGHGLDAGLLATTAVAGYRNSRRKGLHLPEMAEYVSDARGPSGDLFGIDQLVNLVSRTAGDDPPPETMRRLMHAVEDHNDGPMRDDATVVMIEWQGVAPPT